MTSRLSASRCAGLDSWRPKNNFLPHKSSKPQGDIDTEVKGRSNVNYKIIK